MPPGRREPGPGRPRAGAARLDATGSEPRPHRVAGLGGLFGEEPDGGGSIDGAPAAAPAPAEQPAAAGSAAAGSADTGSAGVAAVATFGGPGHAAAPAAPVAGMDELVPGTGEAAPVARLDAPQAGSGTAGRTVALGDLTGARRRRRDAAGGRHSEEHASERPEGRRQPGADHGTGSGGVREGGRKQGGRRSAVREPGQVRDPARGRSRDARHGPARQDPDRDERRGGSGPDGDTGQAGLGRLDPSRAYLGGFDPGHPDPGHPDAGRSDPGHPDVGHPDVGVPDVGDPGSTGAGPGTARGGGRSGRGAGSAGGAWGRGGGRSGAPAELDPDADPVAVAREICLRLLTDRARTRHELAQALQRKGVPDDAAEQVLGRFDEVGLIDDAAFAGQWVRSRHGFRGLGRRAIAMELRRKGVADDIAGEALAEVDADSEARRARELVDRKLRSVTLSTPDERAAVGRRLVGMLARKGYGPGTAYAVVREALAAHGADIEELGAADPEDD